MEKLGVLGGMGPLATSQFMDRIIRSTVASKDQEHINMVVLNHSTLPDRTNIIKNGNHDEFLSRVKEDIKILEIAETTVISIPCNTSHYFFDKIQSFTKIPIINMIEETCKTIKEMNPDGTVVVFGTDGTINSGVYQKYAIKVGLKIHSQTTDEQQIVMETIYNVKNNQVLSSDKFNEILAKYNKLNIKVILACTELSCLDIPYDLKLSTIDAMEVLVKKSIEKCNKEYIA